MPPREPAVPPLLAAAPGRACWPSLLAGVARFRFLGQSLPMQLAHSLVAAPGADPQKYMLFLHGLLGTRSNWRSIARQFVQQRPGWGAVLVDLREHGESRGFDEPHTVAAAAQDVETLARSLNRPVSGALGHSFGGKVALAWATRTPNCELLWLIDSAPGASAIQSSETGRPSEQADASTVTADVLRIIEVLGALSRSSTHQGGFESREAFIEQVSAQGISRGVAQWLAMNLVREANAFRFGPNMAAIDALFADHREVDLWPELERMRDVDVHLVIGEASTAFNSEDRSKAARVAASRSNVSIHRIARAGHWIHVDAPETLLDTLVEHIPLLSKKSDKQETY